ncbi:PBSX family phage terminase large subunit [Metabacillus fastidiosus]|uniref:PBSX family phage terminase large subunit n=1 Tax=Metabacillus fastidiosus TaxID=1458 RepID=A0ABU6NRL4_9BACI|nr:PBSX family phage terminase large subunit [Metabacillus fastidiosus]
MQNELYTPKQSKILKYTMNNDYFMLINHGAKRTGKTILNNDLFLYELRRVKRIAARLGIDNPQYILAGATLGTLAKNVLIELTNKYGIEFQMDKYNRFKLFGVLVVCTGHSKINDMARIRGMTSFGAYINEGSMAHPEVFDEIKSRCSGDGARILVDTNPDHPEHWLKTDYIDNPDESIVSYQFELDDNTFLTERYMRNIKASTPSGMFYDRNIKGLWVSSDGVVYKDFDHTKHYISVEQLKQVNVVKYFAGVDWGYEHYGSIVVIGKADDGKLYIVEEYAKQHQEIDYWVDVANDIKSRYGNIYFYCDTARPEHIDRFEREGLYAENADKSVLSGIEEVAKGFKTDTLLVVDTVERFKKEIYMYAWNERTGEPVKQWDDVLDAVRYAIYTEASYIPAGISSSKGW